jgi:CBS-domain-containing membrane protein
LADEYTRTHGRRVDEMMTRDVVTAVEDTPIESIAQLMEDRRVKRLPVVRDGKVVGIVSRANLLRAVGAAAVRTHPAAASDTAIRTRILNEIDRQPWGPRASVNVVVNNGVVHLHGAILDDRERQALIVLAENTPGVKDVRDHLVWVEPMSGMVLPPDGSGPRRL